MSCSYIYNGKTYTRYQIGKVIREENLYPKSNSESAKKWLRDKLGMSEDQIRIVKGLIDGKSFGRVLKDGSILLSDQMMEGTEYHEAFHSVFNLFLTNQERQDIFNEFRSRNNWESLLVNKKKDYIHLTEDALIEEYLADEFMMYTINNGNYDIPGVKSKNFFDWLYNFFKSLFTGKVGIQELYDKINQGNFKTKNQKVYKLPMEKDLLKVQDTTISPDQKNEIFGSVQVNLLKRIFGKNLVYELIADKIDITNDLINSIQETLDEITSDELYNDIFDDVYNEKTSKINPDSNFVKEFLKYLQSLGVNLTSEKASILDTEDEVSIEDLESSEEEIAKDYSFMKVSFEFDPKTNMSRAIKLLLASLDSGDKSKILGLTQPVRVNEVSTLLYNNLSNLPQDLDVLIERLIELSEKHPYLDQLIDKIKPIQDYANVDYNFLKFRNEFVQTFSKTLYDFQIGLIKKGDIFSIPAISNNVDRRVVTEAENYLALNYRNSQELLNRLNKPKITFDEIVQVLGFNLDDEDKGAMLEDGKTIESKIFVIKNVLIDSINKGTEIQKLYSELDEGINIRPAIKLISKYIAKKYISDLNFRNAEGKKMWAVSLNNYQTIVLNYLNWIGSKNISKEFKIELIKQHVPNLLSIDNYRDGEIRSVALNKILNGTPLTIGVYDGVDGNKKESFSNLKETDLYAFSINQPFEGIFQSIKHSSRQTIFTYSFGDKYVYVENPDYNILIENALSFFEDYLKDELAVIKAFKNGEIDKNWSRFKDNGAKLQNFSYLNNDPALNNAIETGNVSALMGKVRNHITKTIDEYGRQAELNSIFEGTKPVGISAKMWDYFYKGNKNDKAKAIRAAIAFSWLNNAISHIEEQKLFTGSTAFYKDLSDEYKRLSSQSSTGDVMIDDHYNNAYIQYVNQRDSKKLYNPVTQIQEDFVYEKPVGFFSEIVTEEYDEYVSDMTEIRKDIYSPITLQPTSTLRFIHESGLIKDLKPFLLGKGYTEEQINKIIINRAEAYEANYKKINENDGQSHITIFAYREYEHRAGKWTKEKENNFQLQLKALTLKSKEELKDISVFVKPVLDSKGKLLASIVKAYSEEDYIEVRPFDFNDVQSKLGVDGMKWFNATFTPFTPLKGQYVGGVFKKIDDGNLNIPGIRKTSYFPLSPTMIVGTNLQKLNTVMIKNGTDLHHFKSAAKIGTQEDIKVPFYNDKGDFNYDFINDNIEQAKTFLLVKYMKDQLKVDPKAKKEIKNSTQSAKIVLSNLMYGGYPKDLDESLRQLFDNSTEEEKKNLSDFYKLISEYKSTLNSLIQQNINALKNELEVVTNDGGDTFVVKNFRKLIDTLIQSAEYRGSPIPVLEAIEKFSDSKIIETLSNKNKIENILFSLVTNKVINFKRPGDAKAQVAITGFEDSNRKLIDGKLGNSEVLKFYEPVIKNNKIVKVNPAQIALPLPQRWFKMLMDKYETTNIQEAIEKYNNADNTDKFLVKGLRIPNQQLSSNEILEIKTFYLPLTEAFIQAPTEIVVKSGSDFDIDKLQLYYPEEGKEEYNRLLKIESEILLHPNNLHNLLKPLVDDLLKIDIQSKVKALTTIESELHPFDIIDSRTNINKFIQFIETKFGVAPFALSITSHSVAQVDNISINNEIYISRDKKGNPMLLSTTIPFEGKYDNSLGRILDEQGNDIIEMLSIALTSQVDGEKDPYARLLGISNQTLGIVSYLLRRGVPFETIIYVLKQPVIDDYLKVQRVNESQIIEVNKLAKKTRKRLIDSYLVKNKLSKSAYEQALNNLKSGNFIISNKELRDNIRNQKLDAKGLALFVYLINVAKYFRLHITDLTADTKAIKDMAAYETIENNYKKMIQANIIKDTDSYRRGLLKPFFNGRELYRKLFKNFYFTRSFQFSNELSAMKSQFASIRISDDDKVKVANQIENQLLGYIVQNFHPLFKERTFESLMLGDNTLAKKIQKILNDPSHQLHNNYALKNMYVELNNVKDEVTDSKVDNIRIYERNLPVIALNDLYEIFQELPIDLQEDFIALHFYQTGTNPSPYNLYNILPVDKVFDIMQESIKYANQMNWNDFVNKFQTNNTEHLPTNNSHAKFNGFMYYMDGDILRTTVYTDVPKGVEVQGTQVPIQGTKYYKVYNRGVSNIETIEPEIIDEEVVEETITKITSKNDIYSQLGNKTKSENVVIDEVAGRKPAVESNIVSKISTPIIAYRTRGNNFLEALEKDNAIGNPWSYLGNDKNQNIKFEEEKTFGYKNRTIKNTSADATIAIAVDFTTAGEKLTKDYVLNQNKKYIALDANNLEVTKERVDKIVEKLNSVSAKTLNIAGSDIYAMKGKYTQQQVDNFTYELLNKVLNSPNLKTKIESIRSGGQTGFDEAGVKAGVRLNISTLVLAPKGWTFRNIYGQNISNEQQFKARFNLENKNQYGLYKTNTVKEAVEEFIAWMIGEKHTDKLQDYRKAIINRIPEMKGKTILYYKDLGRPSHATALDYLINKYDWSKETTSTVTEPPINNRTVNDISEVTDTDWMNEDEVKAALSAINNNKIEINCKISE